MATQIQKPIRWSCMSWLSVFILMSNIVIAQTDTVSVPDTIRPSTGSIQLAYKHYGDSVVLRWGYDHPQLWYDQLTKPVTIWRRDVTNDKPYEKIGTVTPWDSTRMEQLAARVSNPDMLVVVLENMHRHWENTYFNGYASVLERNDNFFNRWSLVHLAADRDKFAATAAGLRLVDHAITLGVTYAYKVVTHNGSSADYKVAFHSKPTFTPVIFDAMEGEGAVILHWEKKLHDQHYTSYWIEQSDDGRNFQRINQAPYVQMQDESIKTLKQFYGYSIPVNNYRKKHYRIIGLDAFGDMSKPSEPVIAMGRDRTAPASPQVWADTAMTHLTRQLEWVQPDTGEVQTYDLERHIGNESVRIQNWASGTQRKKTDSLTVEGVYRYRLIAIDTAGNEKFSEPVYAKVYDLVPPSAPAMPQSVTDTSGIIVLSWLPHADNDVIGYHIYAADGKARSFTRLNQHIHREHVYVDSINVHMMNEKRYYRIAAVDNDYMVSEFSQVVEVQRPDVIPPAPALIGDYRVLPEGVRLTVLPSSSRDVVRHEIHRREGEMPWTSIAGFTSIPSSFLDTTARAATTYSYRVIAYDVSKLASSSVKDIVITTLPAMQRAPVLTYALQDESVELHIDNADVSANRVLFRSEAESPFVRYASFAENNFSEKLMPGKSVRYCVRTTNNEGTLGPVSNIITVQLPSR